MSGKMPLNALNSSRTEKSTPKSVGAGRLPDQSTALNSANGTQSEEDKIAAMFQAGAEQWDKQQQEMAT